jgi:uncharacterized repeat protein (TIGR03803 family)
MKLLLASIAFFALAICAFAQARSAPPVAQLFAFYCTANYELCPNGFQPDAGPIQVGDNFYGTTTFGTTGLPGGIVWQANLSGDVSNLYTFTPNGSGQWVNGVSPVNLTVGADGDLYGMTAGGGANESGVFYSLTPGGTQQVLYSFCSLAGCPDVPLPVVLGGDGNFYGTTPAFVFRLTPEGVWSQFYSFGLPNTEGDLLIAGTDGNLYGFAFSDPFGPRAKGIVFRLTTSGVYSIVHSFGKEIGVTVLTQSSNGTLFGAFTGLKKSGIFEISSAGVYKVLQKTLVGSYLPTLLVPGSDGNLYGLISSASDNPSYPGSVFAVSPKGKTIFSEEFNCATIGCFPLSLIEASDGNFYGLALKGGTVSPGDIANGTIFKVATGLKEH